MKIFITLLAALAITACSTTQAIKSNVSSESSFNKDTLELLEITQTKKAMNDMSEMMFQAMAKQLPNKPNYLKGLKELTHKYFGYEASKNDIMTLWEESFSNEEIKGLITFYRSDLGKKLVVEQPKIIKKIGLQNQKITNSPAYKKDLADFIKRIRENN